MSFGSFGFTEILLIVLVILVLFGPKRLPDLARSCGKAVNEFKSALQGKGKKLQG